MIRAVITTSYTEFRKQNPELNSILYKILGSKLLYIESITFDRTENNGCGGLYYIQFRHDTNTITKHLAFAVSEDMDKIYIEIIKNDFEDDK